MQTIQGVSFLCVNLEVLKTTTNTNIYIYIQTSWLSIIILFSI
jgi:hypothetical protein